MAWSLKNILIIAVFIANITRGHQNEVRKDGKDLCEFSRDSNNNNNAHFVTWNDSPLNKEYLVTHKCKNKKISPWCVDIYLKKRHPCKLILDNVTLFTDITKVKGYDKVKLEVGSSLALGIHTIEAKNGNLKLILLDPDGYRTHHGFRNKENYKTTSNLDGHQMQDAYHPNSTSETIEENDIAVTLKFDSVVAGILFTTSTYQ